MPWDVFISHASEEKDRVVIPLASALEARGVVVWVDIGQIKLGDSLKDIIEDGLLQCRYGVVILSKAFFRKQWPKKELEVLLSRETAGGTKVILPVLYDLELSELLQLSPLLAGVSVAQWSHGIDRVCEQITDVVLKSASTRERHEISPFYYKCLDLGIRWERLRHEYGTVTRAVAVPCTQGIDRFTFGVGPADAGVFAASVPDGADYLVEDAEPPPLNKNTRQFRIRFPFPLLIGVPREFELRVSGKTHRGKAFPDQLATTTTLKHRIDELTLRVSFARKYPKSVWWESLDQDGRRCDGEPLECDPVTREAQKHFTPRRDRVYVIRWTPSR